MTVRSERSPGISGESIRILIVDDHRIVRAGLSRLLSTRAGISVVGEAESGEAALPLARQQRPDVVLMDVSMPGMGGLEATRRLTDEFPRMQIIALTVWGEEPFPARMLEAGASGYLTKDCDPDEIVTAIRTVRAGECYFAQRIAQRLALKSMEKKTASGFKRLSARELEVLLMIAQGAGTTEMARRLDLSPKTISTYRVRLLQKVGASSDVELITRAFREGILKSPTQTNDE